MLSSCIGAATATIGVMVANGAPQEAAVAAIAIAMAVIPYCLAKAVTEFKALDRPASSEKPSAIPPLIQR